MGWHAWIVVIAMAQADTVQTDSTALTPMQQREVTAACDAFERSSPRIVLQRLTPLLSQLRLREPIEAELRRRDLPTLAETLKLSRLALLRRGQDAQLPRARRDESLLLIPALKDHLLGVLDEIGARPVMHDVLSLPKTMKEFQSVFWQLGTVEGLLSELEQTAEYLSMLARNLAKTDLEKLDDQTRKMVENKDVDVLLASGDSIRSGLEERRVELAIYRLELAVRILSQRTVTPQRVLAAGAWSGDLERITTFLKKSRSASPRRPALREAGLLQRMNAEGEKARKLAGRLSTKAKLLHDGLQWWLRGRYGVGPEVMGLVKNKDAMRSPKGRFALSMPAATPRPTDPFGKASASNRLPQYPLRHLYTWAWGNRYIHIEAWTKGEMYQQTGSKMVGLQRAPRL